MASHEAHPKPSETYNMTSVQPPEAWPTPRSINKDDWRTIMKRNNSPVFLLLLLATVIFSPMCLYADQDSGLSNGQTIYVPAYSHIYIGNREQPFLLTITLSIRNVDPTREMKINRVDYYETQGKLLKKYVDTPVLLKPLESLRYIVPEKDRSGGSGANFIVAWESAELINPPIIETIMVGAQHQQGVSFTSRGKTIILHGK
jgi:hypothetical protein